MATYYVDATTGDDGDSGLTEALAWQTIGQVNGETFSAGDYILFKRGETFSGQLRIQGGASGAPVFYGAYGTGANPILDNAGASWVVVTDHYAASPVSWFVLENLQITGSTQRGLSLDQSSHFVVRNCNIYDNVDYGINVSVACSAGEIYNNTIHDNDGDDGDGMWLTTITGFDIHHNEVYNHAGNGIGISLASDGNAIHHNDIHDNDTAGVYAGIGIEVDSESNEVYNNLLYSNGHAGFVVNSPNNEIYHNTIYGYTGYCIVAVDWNGTAPQYNVFKNNIFLIPDTYEAIFFLDNGTAGAWDELTNDFDYNIYYYLGANGNSKSDLIVGQDNDYTFAQWQTAGQEADGMGAETDPLLVNLDADDFHLQSTSPCRGAGVDVGVTDDYDGVARGDPPDIGAYEFPNVVPVLYYHYRHH